MKMYEMTEGEAGDVMFDYCCNFNTGRKEVMAMGMTKNLMLQEFPDESEWLDDFIEWSHSFDDFMKKSQADEPAIHQPALVKNRNLLTEF